jgi:hypothetical protein
MIAIAGGAKLPPVEMISFEDLQKRIQQDEEYATVVDLRIGEDKILARKSAKDSPQPFLFVDAVTDADLNALVVLLQSREIPFEVVQNIRAPRFPDTWPHCLFGVFCSVAGIVFWRIAIRTAKADAITAEADPKTSQASPHELLTDGLKAAQLLEPRLEALDGESIIPRLDDLMERYILPFAEMRHRVLDQFGMSAGAEILIATSVAERMFNRTWSAAADGYPEEARSSFREAVQALEEANDRWRRTAKEGERERRTVEA